MEATKKTTASKAAVLVVAALSMLLSGLFVASASRVDATPTPACPDGFNLTQDGKACYQQAVITSADNPNSCPKDDNLPIGNQPQLTPDGLHCYIRAQILPQEGKTLCPEGYSPDTSLGGVCARFEKATKKDKSCPEGAFGKKDGCYIYVSKGPAGENTCKNGTLKGTECEIVGNPPVHATGKCPESDTVIKGADGACYSLVAAVVSKECPTLGGHLFVKSGSACKFVMPGANTPAADNFTCPTGSKLIKVKSPTDGHMKAGWCEASESVVATTCPSGSDRFVRSDGKVECRKSVTLTKGQLKCDSGYALLDGKCVRRVQSEVSKASCPNGSYTDHEGRCRKPVANKDGAWYCKDSSAALSGSNCVFTTGFLVKPADTLYKCPKGTRTVIGSGSVAGGDGSKRNVICITGEADKNVTTGPSCLQGELDSTQKYCLVARIDSAPAAPAVAAPKPAFTG